MVFEAETEDEDDMKFEIWLVFEKYERMKNDFEFRYFKITLDLILRYLNLNLEQYEIKSLLTLRYLKITQIPSSSETYHRNLLA